MRPTILLASIDAWRWLEDHGALTAAFIAAAGSWWAAWYTARRSRRSQREERKHELRLPIYLAFGRAVAELDTESALQWENQFGGPGLEWKRTSTPLLDDCAREVMRHLADVEMAGPPELAEKARTVQSAVFAYWQAHYRPDGPPQEVQTKFETAFEDYRAEARKVLGLPA